MTNDMSLAAWILFLICFIGVTGGYTIGRLGLRYNNKTVTTIGACMVLTGWAVSFPALPVILFT